MADFKAWCADDGEEPEKANVHECGTPRDAAELYAECSHPDHDYCDALVVSVRDESGRLSVYQVDAEASVSFRATFVDGKAQ